MLTDQTDPMLVKGQCFQTEYILCYSVYLFIVLMFLFQHFLFKPPVFSQTLQKPGLI